MRLVGTASADEVVATFLRGDLDSPRFGDRLRALLHADGTDVSVIAEPDLTDAAANEYRSALLGRHHDWISGERVFGPFPSALEWSRALLTPEEVLGIRYIDWDWWLRISCGMRLPLEARSASGAARSLAATLSRTSRSRSAFDRSRLLPS